MPIIITVSDFLLKTLTKVLTINILLKYDCDKKYGLFIYGRDQQLESYRPILSFDYIPAWAYMYNYAVKTI